MLPAAVLSGGTETAEDMTESAAATKTRLLVMAEAGSQLRAIQMAGLIGRSRCPGFSVLR